MFWLGILIGVVVAGIAALIIFAKLFEFRM